MSNEIMDRRQRWETIYGTKPITDVSWFEAEPQVSLERIERASPTQGSVIDVGGGASPLVERLLAADFMAVAILDISATALEHAKTRLGAVAARVKWIVADVTEVDELGAQSGCPSFSDGRRRSTKYVRLAARTIPVGGHLIIGIFAVDGPQKCSGMEACPYDAAALSEELGTEFRLVEESSPHFPGVTCAARRRVDNQSRNFSFKHLPQTKRQHLP